MSMRDRRGGNEKGGVSRVRAWGFRRASSPPGVDESERDGKEAMGVPEGENAHNDLFCAIECRDDWLRR